LVDGVERVEGVVVVGGLPWGGRVGEQAWSMSSTKKFRQPWGSGRAVVTVWMSLW